MFESFKELVRDLYNTNGIIPLHVPCYNGDEKDLIIKSLSRGYMANTLPEVETFEELFRKAINTQYAVATISGTSALHVALLVAGIEPGDEVITSSLSHVSSTNAITYCGAIPVFVDTEEDLPLLSATSLASFLNENCEVGEDGICRNKTTGRKVKACMPVHLLGHSSDLYAISDLCKRFNLKLVENAAGSLGSLYRNKYTGTIGDIATFSFNHEMIVTSGNGGMICTNDAETAAAIEQLIDNARVPHPWEFEHNKIAHSYTISTINAALGSAQLAKLERYIKIKRTISKQYDDWAKCEGVETLKEPDQCTSNYWLNAISLNDIRHRNDFIEKCHNENIMVRPLWKPLHMQSIYESCQQWELDNTEQHYQQTVMLPSSVICNH
jgi:dTDP-4-amino-4,6-dideoxygalactose transaminase